MNWIELNVEDENVIKSAIQFFEYEDSALKAIIKMAKLDLSAVNFITTENSSLSQLLSDYRINTPFNKEKANNKLKKGLNLILTEGYTYNGLYFEKGNTKTWG
jgi:hypothetical protein